MNRSKNITKLVLEGKSLREIAKIEKIDSKTVHYWVKKLGLKTKLATNSETKKRPPLHDLSGQKFGRLTVITMIQKGKNGSWYSLCKCDCGNEKLINTSNLLRYSTISCGCKKDQYKKIRGKNSSQFTGYEEILGTVWTKIKTGAKKRNLEFNITIEKAWTLFLKQNRKCAISGLLLNFPSTTSKLKEGTASLDRIDNTKGYSIDNVQWVHKQINYMKNTLSDESLILFCKAIYENNF